MHRSTTLTLIATVLMGANCASVPVNQNRSATVVIPFVANSLHPQFGTSLFHVRGRLVGTASIEHNWISILVPRAAVVLMGDDPLQWQSLRVSGILARGSPIGGWSIATRSLPIRLFPLLGLTTADTVAGASVDTLRILSDTLRFQVPIPPGGSLAKTWIVFEFEQPALLSARPLRGTFAYYYAHF
jgi:hypothetical protein